jgi:hypothetical protein
MARLVKDNRNVDGWISIEGNDGKRYGCQTRQADWWWKTSGIAGIAVGEHEIPADVIALADQIAPNRAK